jgi:hypothetical protein
MDFIEIARGSGVGDSEGVGQVMKEHERNAKLGLEELQIGVVRSGEVTMQKPVSGTMVGRSEKD